MLSIVKFSLKSQESAPLAFQRTSVMTVVPQIQAPADRSANISPSNAAATNWRPSNHVLWIGPVTRLIPDDSK